MPASKLRAALGGTGLLVGLFCALVSTARADSYMPDMLFGTLGYKPQVGIAGIGASWYYFKPRVPPPDESAWSFHLDGEVAYWRGYGRPTDYNALVDFSAMPIFRWTFAKPAAPRLFVEGGLGFHFLTRTRINSDRLFGISFQFGESIGVGAVFGDKNQYEAKFYVQHVSNGGINKDNGGLTTPAVTFSMAIP